MGVFDTLRDLVAPAEVGAGSDFATPGLSPGALAWRSADALTVDQIRATSWAKGLVWAAPSPAEPVLFDGTFSTLGGRDVPIVPRTPLRLWHPVESPREVVCVWADALASHGIVQPFDQVLRPAYPVDAQVLHRFFGHFVLRDRFLRSAERRGWTRGPADVQISRDGAELALYPISHKASDTRYSVIGELKIPVRLGTIEHSELLRDIDLIVLGSSVANDLRFSVGPEAPLWLGSRRVRPWGDLGAAGLRRATQLAELLPQTRLGPVARLVGPALVVETEPTYRVHLDSTRVRRAWSNTTVIVRPDPKTEAAAAQLLLPFDGDLVLRAVLAKALQLAAK